MRESEIGESTEPVPIQLPPVVTNGKVYISTGHDPSAATNPQGETDVYWLK